PADLDEAHVVRVARRQPGIGDVQAGAQLERAYAVGRPVGVAARIAVDAGLRRLGEAAARRRLLDGPLEPAARLRPLRGGHEHDVVALDDVARRIARVARGA